MVEMGWKDVLISVRASSSEATELVSRITPVDENNALIAEGSRPDGAVTEIISDSESALLESAALAFAVVNIGGVEVSLAGTGERDIFSDSGESAACCNHSGKSVYVCHSVWGGRKGIFFWVARPILDPNFAIQLVGNKTVDFSVRTSWRTFSLCCFTRGRGNRMVYQGRFRIF